LRLIDRYLPVFQFRERHQLVVDARAEGLIDAAMVPENTDDPWVRTFIQLRELPDRLLAKFGRRSALAEQTGFGLGNFTFLGRDSDREIAFGLVGKFWRLDYRLEHITDPQDFDSFVAAGVPKLVLNFSVELQDDGRKTLVTETRVFCNDRRSRLCFLPYWSVIRPVSGLMRLRLLSRIRDAAST
jgi:hypothetical protein